MGATRGRSLDYDIVRGLGIVLVVWGHVWRAMEAAGLIGNDRLFARIDELVYSFHMPLFFLLSGLFFRPEAGLRAFLRLRVQLMVWPLLLWSWVEAGFLLVAGRFSNRGALSLEEALLFPFPPKSVFWFLFALLICHLVAYGLARLLPRWQKPAILGFGLALLIGRGLGLDFGLFTMFSIHFLYFALGYLRILPAPRAEAGWGRVAQGLGLFALGLAATLLLGPGPDLIAPLFKALRASVEVAGFLIFAAALVPVALQGGLARIGQLTMPIYVAHIIFAAAMRVVLLRLGIDNLGLHLLAGCAIGVGGPLLMLGLLRQLGISHLAGLERQAPQPRASQGRRQVQQA